MTDSSPPQVPSPVTLLVPEHAQAFRASRTLYRQLALSVTIPTVASGIVFLLTGNTEDISPAAIVASQFYTIYLTFTFKEQRGALILFQTILLGTHLLLNHYEYRTYAAYERISSITDETSLRTIKENQEAIQKSTEAIIQTIDSDTSDRNSRLDELLQTRDRAVRDFLSTAIENRLNSRPPLATKEELHARMVRATVFGGLILICAGIYLFTLRTYYRITYGAIEVAFAITAAFTAMSELLDAEGATKWIGIGASIYLIVRGLDNIEQGWTKRRQLIELSAQDSNSEAPATTSLEEKLPEPTPLPLAGGAESPCSTPHQQFDEMAHDRKADVHLPLSTENKASSSN